jgi:hypothetical protein
MVWPPWPTSNDVPSSILNPRETKDRGTTKEIFRRCSGWRTRERKAFRQAEFCREITSLRGEIIAIATAIKLDFIGIIITIISTTSTIITTVSTPYRCNTLGSILF